MFRSRKKSASKAKDRLKLVLIHDRIALPPGVMEELKNELIQVISKHVDVDRKLVQIEFSQEGRSQRLIADIPILPSQRKRTL
ncbi:MAG: cell division topological specificity factor MinE [Chloroflexi bacterium]|nr:cell division topological specificity factor MinE [Chloroflexota bacterium]